MKSKPRAPATPRSAKAAKAPRTLKPGRPLADETVVRRQLLLETAIELFASQGIAGTSLNAIAQRAKVTPALVHYYFGNKEQLVQVMIDEHFMPIVKAFNQYLDTRSQDPLATLILATRQMLEITASIPWLSALWVREVLSEDGHLREWMQAHVMHDMSEKIRRLTIAAQRKGQLNKKLDARLMIVSMIGLALFPLASAPLWKNIPANKNISTAVLGQHMLELLTHGIEAKQ